MFKTRIAAPVCRRSDAPGALGAAALGYRTQEFGAPPAFSRVLNLLPGHVPPPNPPPARGVRSLAFCFSKVNPAFPIIPSYARANGGVFGKKGILLFGLGLALALSDLDSACMGKKKKYPSAIVPGASLSKAFTKKPSEPAFDVSTPTPGDTPAKSSVTLKPTKAFSALALAESSESSDSSLESESSSDTAVSAGSKQELKQAVGSMKQDIRSLQDSMAILVAAVREKPSSAMLPAQLLVKHPKKAKIVQLSDESSDFDPPFQSDKLTSNQKALIRYYDIPRESSNPTKMEATLAMHTLRDRVVRNLGDRSGQEADRVLQIIMAIWQFGPDGGIAQCAAALYELEAWDVSVTSGLKTRERLSAIRDPRSPLMDFESLKAAMRSDAPASGGGNSSSRKKKGKKSRSSKGGDKSGSEKPAGKTQNKPSKTGD